MTGGFFAKFYVFSAALKANLLWLTLIGVVNSAIGAYYYLRILVVMYMRESRKDSSDLPRFRSGWAWHSRSASWRHSISASCRTASCNTHSSRLRNCCRSSLSAGPANAAQTQPPAALLPH